MLFIIIVIEIVTVIVTVTVIEQLSNTRVEQGRGWL